VHIIIIIIIFTIGVGVARSSRSPNGRVGAGERGDNNETALRSFGGV